MKTNNIKNEGYKEKLIKISRNSKVVKGGRVFSFSAFTVIGDQNGSIGIGKGKAKEVPIAIKKSIENAHKNMKKIFINKYTILYKIKSHYCSSTVILIPAYKGTGIIASHVIRSICEVVGIKDIIAKCIGSTNPINVLKATLTGLNSITKIYNIKKK